jgi:Aldehyde dehydrogenase family
LPDRSPAKIPTGLSGLLYYSNAVDPKAEDPQSVSHSTDQDWVAMESSTSWLTSRSAIRPEVGPVFSCRRHSIVRENGKLLSEARGSLRRGLDVVEFACGIPSQLMGRTLTDISRDVDCHTIREPVGVVVGIPPFNFPALIPLWMMSVAVAFGNTFVLKPAEKAPLTGSRLVELFADTGSPPGVVGVVQGSKEVSERQPHRY